MVYTSFREGGMGSNYARYIGVGFTLILALAVPTAIGFFVDYALGTLPLFLLIGVALGFFGGLYYVYLKLKNLGAG